MGVCATKFWQLHNKNVWFLKNYTNQSSSSPIISSLRSSSPLSTFKQQPSTPKSRWPQCRPKHIKFTILHSKLLLIFLCLNPESLCLLSPPKATSETWNCRRLFCVTCLLLSYQKLLIKIWPPAWLAKSEECGTLDLRGREFKPHIGDRDDLKK